MINGAVVSAATKRATVITVAARVCAIAIIIVGLPLLWYGPVANAAMANVPIQFALQSGELRVRAVNTPDAKRLDVKPDESGKKA